jgi:magnesium transporter
VITVYRPRAGTSLDRHRLDPGEAIPTDALWIDLMGPTREEDQLVEAHLGIAIPTREEMQDIEPSSLLYVENGARYMTARILCHSDTATPKLTPVSFISTEKALVTVRYDDPRSFQIFSGRVAKPDACSAQPESVLDGLIEAIIDRAAEVLRQAGDSRMSSAISAATAI